MVSTNTQRPTPGGTNRPVPTPAGGPGVFDPSGAGANITVGTPAAQGGGSQGPSYPTVGTSTYDVYRIHEMMQDAGYDGWEMIGQPVQVVQEKTNPSADPSSPLYDPNAPATTSVGTQTWIINIRKGDQIKQIQMSKLWPTSGGGTIQNDPGDGSQYTWSPTNVSDLQKTDPNKVGHSNLMTIGGTIYGTNNATGAFEPVPNAPTVPKGWTDIKQVTNEKGDLVWYGTDPADQQYRAMPGMPTIPASMSGWGDPRQIDNGQGQLVWYGVDPADKQLKPMPNMPSVAKQTGPGSITQAGTVYVLKPDGTYGPAPGVPDPNPAVGATRIKLGDDGYLYQETYAGGGSWNFDPTFKSVPYSEAAKATAAKTAGTTTHQAGEQGDKLLSDGKIYRVTYKGGGDDNYEVDTTVAARPMAGASSPTQLSGTGVDQPKIGRQMPDGTVQWVDNPNYQPTDPALRVQQLTGQASSKLAELQGKIGPNYTPEQAQTDFDQWWTSTIEPAKQQLNADQQQKQLDQQLKISAEQRAWGTQQQQQYTAAEQAGTNAVEAYKATLPYQVGPNFGNVSNQIAGAFASGKAPGNLDIGSAVTFQMPDLNQLAQQATANALAHMSPTAAGIAGQGPPQFAQPQQVDYNQLLNRNSPQYQFHAGPVAQATPVTATNGAPAAAGVGAAMPFGAIGPNPMQNAMVNPAYAPYQYQGSF